MLGGRVAFGIEGISVVEPGCAVERRRDVRLDRRRRSCAPANPRRRARKAGVAITVSPIRFGQKTTMFMCDPRAADALRAGSEVEPGPLPSTGSARPVE